MQRCQVNGELHRVLLVLAAFGRHDAPDGIGGADHHAQGAGYAAAAAVGITVSCGCPRQRGYIGRFSSGYCWVMGLVNTIRRVVANPLSNGIIMG